MANAQQRTVIVRTSNWRQWIVVAAIGVGLTLQAFLRSSHWQGVIVSTSRDETLYRLSPWWLALFALPAGVFFVLSFAIGTVRHPIARLVGVVALLAGLFIVVAVAPSPWVNRLRVTPDGFTHTAGFWWQPRTHDVRFSSLVAMHVVPERRESGPISFILECRQRDGGIVRIPESTVLKAGRKRIFYLATQHGIEIPVEELLELVVPGD